MSRGDIDKFTAVLLADSFTNDFRPLTMEVPRTLLPVAGVPMIDYIIDFLVSNGVDEIFVFCSAFGDTIKEFLHNSPWGRSSLVTIRCLRGRCDTPAEALRHLNAQDVLRNDFVLVPGDLITNFRGLADVMQRHKQRREQDPTYLFTMVFQEQPFFPDGHAGGGESDRLEERVTALIDPTNSQLLDYKPWMSQAFAQAHDAEDPTRLAVNLQLLKDHPAVQMRSDLVDSNIVICSPELLTMFRENFDFNDIKHDCVKSVLEEELLDNKIAVHTIKAPFLHRVRCLQDYFYCSQAVVGRWTFPMVPEVSIAGASRAPQYRVQSRNIYIATNAVLARTVQTKQDIILGPATTVEDGVVLSGCIVGAECSIGKGSVIENSVLWDGVQVGDNCVLRNCLVASRCCIKNGAMCSPGVIMSFEVTVGTNHVTRPGDRLWVDGTDANAVGDDGVGTLWQPPEEDTGFFDVRQEDMDDCSSTDTFHELADPRPHTGTSVEDQQPEDERFLQEATGTVVRALQEGHEVEHCTLEMKALKFSYDRSFMDCAQGILLGFLSFAETASSGTDFVKTMERSVKSYARLLLGFVTTNDIGKDLFDIMCEEARSRKLVKQCFHFIVKMLVVDNEIVEQEAFLEWAHAESDDEHRLAIVKKCEKIIEYLEASDDDEEEEEEEDDD